MFNIINSKVQIQQLASTFKFIITRHNTGLHVQSCIPYNDVHVALRNISQISQIYLLKFFNRFEYQVYLYTNFGKIRQFLGKILCTMFPNLMSWWFDELSTFVCQKLAVTTSALSLGWKLVEDVALSKTFLSHNSDIKWLDNLWCIVTLVSSFAQFPYKCSSSTKDAWIAFMH